MATRATRRSPKNKWGLTPFIFLLAFPALAAYDLGDVRLGSSEKELKSHFPQANCRSLEWPSRAADRRCDDSRVKVGGMDASVTFYLRNDSVEGFDLRFDAANAVPMRKVLSDRYGAPAVVDKGDVKAEWKSNGERARMTVEQGRRRASLLVWRGAFEDELYKIR
jgi:hypothetical protein